MTGVATNRQGLRKAWFQAHKWIALVLMIVLIPLGLTGVVLAWDDAIDHGLNPKRYAVSGETTLAPSAYAAAAQATLGGDERIAMIRYPDGDGPVIVNATLVPKEKPKHDGPPKRATVWLDPPAARLLDRATSDTGLVRFAHNFHGNLLVPGIGRALVGLLGVVMFLMAASGVWLWWPPMGRWTRGLRWQRGDRKLDTNLHHRVGFWIALPLATQAFTGVWIASPQMIALFGGGAPGGNRARPVPVANPHLAPDAALAAAIGATPGKPLSIAWPTGEDGPWKISLATPKGPANVEVDDASGTAEIARKRDNGGLAMVMRHWHDGTTLGFGWRIVMVAIGLAPTLLGITGLLMWWRGRHWRNPKRVRAKTEGVAA
ncbi:MAG: PepSY protein [Sphingomonas bacterium]|nr:PepSY protein [Sphingomonas bacterium]